MALGENIILPIYNGDGTLFYGLALKKFTYESSVMALDDKISGDVVWIDNQLQVSMNEYVVYNGVPFTLVNPPTIVREGLVSENSDLKAMTRYSFVFYHPMYELSNIPFSDVATSDDEKQYKSQDTSFYWIGYLRDFIDKVAKNLQYTHWEIVLNTSSLEDEDTILSEVKQFENEFIADALKWGYETYHVPYTIEVIKENDQSYADGKLYRIVFGKPTNEIYKDGESEPFVFRFGNGLGLKNNSATPKNNKIITRIAPYGSEDNIPYGYPQIVWEGDQNAQFTIGDSVGVKYNVTINGKTYAKAMSYPIYDGIVGGRYVKLIKHPFTRTHLMPTIFVETLNNKVNPYAENYNPDTELIAYYDADETYPHPLNPLAPSYEAHEFEDIKPEMGDAEIVDAVPYDGKYIAGAITLAEFNTLIDGYIANSTNQVEVANLREIKSFVNSDVENGRIYGHSSNLEDENVYTFEYEFKIEQGYAQGYYMSSGLTFTCAVRLHEDSTQGGDSEKEVVWDDSIDDDGNYVQSYFEMTLPVLDFDIYACAAITQEMNVVMRSGACIGCTFPIQCDWDKYKASFYDEDGSFTPNSERRNYTMFPDSSKEQIKVILQKDTNTFGTLKPSIYEQPKQGDKFVITGISLPLVYVTNAQERLAVKGKEYMRDNNVYYYEYPIKVSESFMYQNEDILVQLANNKVLRFEFAGEILPLFIKEISIRYWDGVLPQYDLTLTDEIEITLNDLGQAIEDIGILGDQMRELHTEVSNSFVHDKLSRMRDDVARGRITFLNGISFRNGSISSNGDAYLNTLRANDVSSKAFTTGFDGEGWRAWLQDGLAKFEVDELTVRKVMNVYELLIHKVRATGGAVIVSAADGKIRTVSAAQFGQWDIEVEDIDGVGFRNGDYVRCQRWDATRNTIKSYWVQVVGSYSNHLILSGDFTSGVPEAGDELVLMGSSVASRQGAVMISAQEGGVPVVDVLNNISGASLAGCLRARLGGLDGIIDPYFGEMQPQGYGLYSDNAWLRGTFVLRNGEEVGTKFAILEDRVSSSVAGYVDAILVVNPTFDGWDGWNVPQSQVNLLTLDGDYIFESGVPVSGFNVLGGAELIDGGGIRFNTNYTLTQTIPNTSIRPDMRYYLEVEYKGDLTEWQVGSIIGGETSEEWKVAIFDVESLYSELGDDCVLTVNTNTEVSIRSIRLLYKSESLIEQTAEAIRLGLADTGIDIERNKIELNAQNISLKGQVKVNMLETTPEQGEARITAVGSRMTASGVNGNVNLEFGVDESGNFGITFYNDDQTKVGTLDAYTMARLLELIKSQSYFDAVTFIDFDNVSVTLYRYNAASSGDPHADGDGKYFTNENDWELANGTYKGGTRNFPTFLYSWSNDGTLSGVQALQAAFVAFNVTSLKDVNGNPVEDYSSLMDGDTYDMVGYIEGRVSKNITDGVYSESTEWIYYKQQ